ncbi:cysteine hydrolase family protein [Ancylomarina sp. 16SWW S1-10-2]|uniref:cysteine hydrolase family protein n=1 Tax=Ancylomarina sp. 16SWW S1-10-2 TaxID=2499681 RepID=UPI0012AE16A5|nr:cysteine hydrolase family protein [Ancylomarina sp. 16SWW S1-10-2]MRT94593.1 cysteine hydrolase [Ancylomarina sp. 16SWW S1-10-2]
MRLRENKPALLLIDLQKGFEDEAYWGGNRNNKDTEEKAAQILSKWRSLNLPVYHIIHSSQDPKSLLHQSHAGFEICDQVKPIDGEPVIIKNVNSGFIGTNLKEQLDNKGITHLVIIGLTTNHCISTTTRMAGNYGYETIVIEDATATFDRIGLHGEKYASEIIHQISLSNLKDEFATIMNTTQLLKSI